jgi:hypothetical protein
MTKSMLKVCVLILLSVLLTACSQSNASDASLGGTDEERAYDLMQRKAQWSEIFRKSQEQKVRSLACRKVAVLAMFRLGMIDRNAAFECLADSREVLSSELAAMMMSDVYMQFGMVSMAQRAAFEAMVKQTDISKCSRSLRRLTETALITGQYEVARKYIYILERDSKHSKWAHSMLRIVENPEFISEYPVYQQLKNSYENTEDQFFM